jgi:hypothetical protein
MAGKKYDAEAVLSAVASAVEPIAAVRWRDATGVTSELLAKEDIGDWIEREVLSVGWLIHVSPSGLALAQDKLELNGRTVFRNILWIPSPNVAEVAVFTQRGMIEVNPSELFEASNFFMEED